MFPEPNRKMHQEKDFEKTVFAFLKLWAVLGVVVVAVLIWGFIMLILNYT